MKKIKCRVVVVCGPTAAGKTRLAAGAAHRAGLEVISADSRQVYRRLDIGSGKDRMEYRFGNREVKCHLIDVADPWEVYSLYHFQKDCYGLFRETLQSGRPFVMAGGSGLYIEAVLKKFDIANVPEDALLRNRMMELDRESLRKQLEEMNPEICARTDTSSKKRIVRALEILAHSQTGPVKITSSDDLDIRYHVFCLTPPREELHRRIHLRLLQRMEEGMVEEVEALLAEGVPEKKLSRLGMEYREITAYLCGRKSLPQMLEDLEKEIRRMAKGQMTWFRGMEKRGIPVEWLSFPDSDRVDEVAAQFSKGC